MPKVRVLRQHATTQGLGVWRKGEVYEETPLAAEQKARAGFVEFVDGQPAMRTTADPDMYAPRQFSVPKREETPPEPPERDGITLQSKSGNWYTFSDGEKVLGKKAAADYIGLSIEELDEYVDTDSG